MGWWSSIDALKTALNVFGGLAATATVIAVILAIRLQIIERRRALDDEKRWSITQGELSSARAESESLRGRQSEAERKLEETQKRAADAEAQLRELAKKTSPRQLTLQQQEKLLAALKKVPKPLGGVRLSAPNGDGEAAGFAEQFAKIFEAAGWSGEYSTPMFAGTPLYGVHVFVQDPKLQAAAVIVSLLREFGHVATIHTDPAYPANHFAVSVRAKR